MFPLCISLLEVWCGTLSSEVEVSVETIFFVVVVVRSFCLSKGAPTAAAAVVGAWWLWKQPEASADCACSWRDVDEAKWNLGCWTDMEAALRFVLWHNSEFYQDGSVNFRKKEKQKTKKTNRECNLRKPVYILSGCQGQFVAWNTSVMSKYLHSRVSLLPYSLSRGVTL